MYTYQLKESLEEKFNLLCFEDLGLLMQSRSGIYRLFHDLYRPEFLPKDRLVFYSKVPIDITIVKHFKKALSMFDIDHDWLVIYTPDQNSPFSENWNWQQMSLIDACDWSGKSYDIDYVCPLPWSAAMISNSGVIRPCCVYTDRGINIRQKSISEVFNGEMFDSIRQQLLESQIPRGCTNCFKDESLGQMSNRQRAMVTFQKDFLVDTIDQHQIHSLDIRGGITCNMKCRICDESSSSLWAAEKSKFGIKIDSHEDWIKDEYNWKQISSLLPHCINMDFFGGEPMLSRQIFRLIEQAQVEDFAKNIRINVNTNGSIWNQDLIDCMKYFKLVNIGISIDNIGQRFELERGSLWSEVEQNVKKFQSLESSNFHSYVFATVNVQNIYYLPDLIDWANELGIDVLFSIVKNPWQLCIDNMTAEARQLVYNRLSVHQDQRLKNIAERVKNSAGTDGTGFVEFMRDLDVKRNENFAISHPEIAKSMGYQL